MLQCSSISGLQKKHLYINFQIYKCFFFILFLTFLANHYHHDNEDNNYCYQINDIVHIALDHHIQTGEDLSLIHICALGTESEPVYIIAVGGDGTIHEVLTGITDFDRVVFGYIPTCLLYTSRCV